MGVRLGTKLLRRTYHTTALGEQGPLSVSTSYLVHHVAATNPDLLDPACEPWAGGTMHQLRTLGIEVDRVVDEVTARPPAPNEAKTLDIGPGVSVICLRKIMIDTNDNVVEVADVVLPGDRTELVYTIQLERWQ